MHALGERARSGSSTALHALTISSQPARRVQPCAALRPALIAQSPCEIVHKCSTWAASTRQRQMWAPLTRAHQACAHMVCTLSLKTDTTHTASPQGSPGRGTYATCRTRSCQPAVVHDSREALPSPRRQHGYPATRLRSAPPDESLLTAEQSSPRSWATTCRCQSSAGRHWPSTQRSQRACHPRNRAPQPPCQPTSLPPPSTPTPSTRPSVGSWRSAGRCVCLPLQPALRTDPGC